MHQASRVFHFILRQAMPLLTLLLITNCTVGPVISSSYNSSANFRVFQTYSWHQTELPTRMTGNGPAYSPLLDQQIKQAIESELVKEGLRPNEENPDLIIAYDIVLPEAQRGIADTAFAPGFGYGYSYWFGYRYRYDVSGLPGYKSVTELTPGTLIIDLINASTNQLVWRGWHETEINPTTAGHHNINKAVANIMSRYPPVPQSTQ